MTEVPADRHTVLIADDHQVLAEGLAATLGQHYTIVGQVHVLDQVRQPVLPRQLIPGTGIDEQADM